MAEQPVLEASTPLGTKHLRTLRWWPAMVLLLLMGTLRFVPTLAEAPSLPIIMISFLGPAAVVHLSWPSSLPPRAC